MSAQLNHRRSSPTRKKRSNLPKPIRDELRMTCALRGYSTIRTGSGMTIALQREKMEQFYHGVEGKSPSQIKMLCEAKIDYADLFETSDIAVVTKKGKKKFKSKKAPTTVRTYLNKAVSKDESALFYIGSDITFSDLKLKNRTGTELLNGRQLLDMAKRGMKDFRKAMAFTGDKWDMKKNTPIESGTTVADVIEYVRHKMYLFSKHAIEEEEEEDATAELEILNDINETKKNPNYLYLIMMRLLQSQYQ